MTAAKKNEPAGADKGLNSFLFYEDAIRVVIHSLRPIPPVTMELRYARGKVLAQSLYARWDLPTADNSAMDGYALSLGELRGDSPLPVIGVSSAGSPFTEAASPGKAVKIMTGGLLPPGCDTVVPLEEVETAEDGIRLKSRPVSGQHVRRRGEEIEKGQLLCKPGDVLTPVKIAGLLAAGITEVRVHPAPRVALFSTGDELMEPGAVPGPGQIVNSNLFLLTGLLQEAGCDVIPLGIARDSREMLDQKITEALTADAIISTGGVSVGERDLVKEVYTGRGMETLFWKVRMKPGKPVLYGLLEGKPVFGLPGNPASSATTFELFVRPALRHMMGLTNIFHPRLRVKLATEVRGDRMRQRFLWGSLRGESGSYLFTPSQRQSSGQNRTMQSAEALLPVPIGTDRIAAGAEIEVLLLRPPSGLPEWEG